MHLDKFLRLLSAQLGIADLPPNDHNKWTLQIEGAEPPVSFEWEEPHDLLHVYACIGAAPTSANPDPYWAVALLHANRFGHETGGATLALYESRLILCRGFELASLDFPQFTTALGRFIAAADHWHKRLLHDTEGSGTAIRSDHPPEPISHHVMWV